MQAVVINKPGGVDVLQLVKDYPLPTRKPQQVLVHVRSSSVNPIDTAVRAGAFPISKLPKILGGDLAGVVEEADPGSRFSKGDHVAALTPGFWFDTPDGTYCQYVAAEEAWLAKLPDNVSLDTAGGLPLVGLTAWQAIMAAEPILGQRVLVLAASGGVGHVAVQICKALGLYVVAVASSRNTDWLKTQLGADEVVDYSKQDFGALYSKADQQFDIIVDPLGNTPDHQQKILAVLKPNGHYSHIANSGTDQAALQAMTAAHAAGKGPGASLTMVKPNGQQLEEIFELVANGKLRLEAAGIFPLDQVADAHQQVETGHTRGKVVLAVP